MFYDTNVKAVLNYPHRILRANLKKPTSSKMNYCAKNYFLTRVLITFSTSVISEIFYLDLDLEKSN
jgi:hypothetical protein